MAKRNGLMFEHDGIYAEGFTPCRSEVILMRFDRDKISTTEVEMQHKFLRSVFPDHIVIGLPSDTSLQTMSKAELTELRNKLSNFIQTLRCE